MIQKVEQIITLLESPQYADRLKGNELLLNLSDPDHVLAFHEVVELQDKFAMRVALQKLLARLLQKENEELCGVALSILFSYRSSDQKSLQKESERLIDDFLGNLNKFQHLKFLAMKWAWKRIDHKEKFVATKKIGIYNLRELLPLLVDNFYTRDEALMVLTMEVMRRVEDKRANRFIRTVLDQKTSKNLILKALETLSELGYFIDVKYFKDFARSEDEEIAVTAVEGLYVMIQDRAIPYVKDLFLHSKQNSTKLKAIEILTRFPTEKSVFALLELWQTENMSAVEHKIEWALNELEGNVKVNGMIKFYHQADETLQFKILSLLNEIHHPKCFEFYSQVLLHPKNDFLCIAAMESLAFYDDLRSTLLLAPFLKDKEGSLHYYALASLVKNSHINLAAVLEDVVNTGYDHDRHYHQLVLSILQEHRSIPELTPRLLEYAKEMMTSKMKDNRYLSYGVFERFYLQYDFDRVFEIFEAEPEAMVRKEAMKTLSHIFSQRPRLFLEKLELHDVLVLEDATFIHQIRLGPDVLRALFERGVQSTILTLQQMHGYDFWRFVKDIIKEGNLSFEQLTWIDLTRVSFDDFVILWQLFLTNFKMRDYLLQSVSVIQDPRFGDFIMDEYLSGRSDEMYPYVSRFINGLT
jgi:HEAT repeat protein